MSEDKIKKRRIADEDCWKDILLTDFEGEIWLPIKGLENIYEISNFGRVKSLNRQGKYKPIPEKIRKLGLNPDGYLRLRLNKTTFKIHRLVGIHFVHNPNNFLEINHKKGIKTDNRHFMIEWSTRLMNMQHAMKTGLKSDFGENHARALLTNNQVIKIFNSNKPYDEISRDFNVSEVLISTIKIGLCWSRITGKKYVRKFISKETVLNIFNCNLPYKDICSKYNVSYTVVCKIKNGMCSSKITNKKHEKKNNRYISVSEI